MFNRNATLLALGLISATPLTALSAGQEAVKIHGDTQEERVVYHISDSANARLALININNHLTATNEKAKIVVVTNAKGIDFLLADAQDQEGKPYQPTVQDLKRKGVDFRVCNNTLVSRKIEQGRVIAEAKIVPSGVAEIGRLQTLDHFVYLKP
jgi:hypothetical protein